MTAGGRGRTRSAVVPRIKLDSLSSAYSRQLCRGCDIAARFGSFFRFLSYDSLVLRREERTATLHTVKVKVHTLDIAPLRSESPPQKRSGMARVLNGFHSFTCTPRRSSAIGMSHTCLCLPSRSWYSFTDPGGMEG